MKYLAIILIVVLLIGAGSYRIMRIELVPKIANAFDTNNRPRGMSKVEWAERQIRRHVKNKVADYLTSLQVVDVNDIANEPR